jgi:hypothetical protein
VGWGDVLTVWAEGGGMEIDVASIVDDLRGDTVFFQCLR